jgi:hypothetical protein
VSTSHHIDELGLRIKTDLAGKDAELRRSAEDLTRAVLGRIADLVEARAPGRVIRVRALPIRWRLDPGMLTGPDNGRAADSAENAAAIRAEIEELAAALVRDLDARLPAPDDRPHDEADLVVFADEAHHLAASLASRARGEQPWYQAEAARAAQPLAALAAPGRSELARAVLADLARMGHIEAMLAAAEPAVIAELAVSLGVAVDFRGEALRATAPNAPMFQAAPGALDAAVTMRALLRHAWMHPRAIAAPFASVAPDVPEGPRAAPHVPPTAPTPDARAAAAAARTGTHADRSPSPEAPRAVSRDGSPTPPAAATASRDASSPVNAAVDRRTEPSGIATAYAGLFYLLNPILELELAEALWRACLPEGRILGHAAAALLGEHRDPAPAVIAGTQLEHFPDASADQDDELDPDPEVIAGASLDRFPAASADAHDELDPATVTAGLDRFPDVSAEQHAELAVAIAGALARALPRRGLAELPLVEITLAGTGAGRLLVACAAGSPFALFAWPAATGGDAARGLAAFLDAWPAAAPVVGHGAAAALDPRGRVRPLAAPGPAPFVPDLPSPHAAALLAQVLGAPCQLMASRIDTDPLPPAALRSRLASPGTIHARGDRLEIVLAASSIDLAIRSAGLDRDPGWCAWLERDVRIHFTD